MRSRVMWMRSLILMALCAISGPLLAQTMYRCGSAYQDQPCAGNQAGVVVGTNARVSTASGAGASASPSADGRCHARGQAAEKIMWAREGGATLAQQVGDPAHPVNSALAESVYRYRGSASQVRDAIEQECVADQARSRDAAKAIAAAQAIQAGNSGSDAMDGAPAARPIESPQRSGGSIDSAASAPVGPTRCDVLTSQASALAKQRLHSLSASDLNSYNAQVSANFNARRDAGCP